MKKIEWVGCVFLALMFQMSCLGQVEESSGAWVKNIDTPQYFAIWVADVDTSMQWYSKVFDLKEIGGSEAEDGTWRIENLKNDRLFVEIVRDDRAEAVPFARGFGKVGFYVADVDIVADRVAAELGERPRVIDFDRFSVRILQLRDPDGNIIQLFSPLG